MKSLGFGIGIRSKVVRDFGGLVNHPVVCKLNVRIVLIPRFMAFL